MDEARFDTSYVGVQCLLFHGRCKMQKCYYCCVNAVLELWNAGSRLEAILYTGILI
jgi:hypothetical protein